MMSGYGGNPIFFNKKIQIGRPEHLLTSHPPTSDNISFLSYPPPPPLKVDVICVSRLKSFFSDEKKHLRRNLRHAFVEKLSEINVANY